MEIRPARNGLPTLVHDGEYLDDPLDPIGAAQTFASPDRVAGSKVVVLFGLGLGYRVRRLRELGVRRIIVFEPDHSLPRLISEHDAAAMGDATVFHESAPLVAALLEASSAGDKTVLLVAPAYRRAYPDAHDKLMTTLREVEGLKQLRKNTIVERMEVIVETGLNNLARSTHIPPFTSLGRPLDGCPAFIVSAGPSLDSNAHLLAEASRRGAIFTVNTASPAVVENGAPIDVLACIESLDVTASLARSASHARLLALDLTANPNNFEVEAAARTFFLPSTQPFPRLAEALGTTTLPYGASVSTAAFALARHWGADPIVLLGQDLAYTGGKVYAKHTGREHMRAVRNGPVVTIDWAEEMLESFRKSGVREPGKRRPAVTLPGWGGGEVDDARYDAVSTVVRGHRA